MSSYSAEPFEFLRPYAKKLKAAQAVAKVGPIDVDKLAELGRKDPDEFGRFVTELESNSPPSRYLVKKVRDLATFKKSGGTFVLRSAEANSHGTYGAVSSKYEMLLKKISG